jgi:UDP-N-acetylmuramate--alanine ligase
VADRLGIGADAIRSGLAAFRGVRRRFTHVGDWNGVAIYDDYGHHPVEIRAVLAAARQAAAGRVIAVVQPHRYSRLSSLFDDFSSCFNDADMVIVADVYAAGEQPIPGADRDHLVAGLRGRGHRDAVPLSGREALAPLIRERAAPGDMVICLGAGSITQWAHALPGELSA